MDACMLTRGRNVEFQGLNPAWPYCFFCGAKCASANIVVILRLLLAFKKEKRLKDSNTSLEIKNFQSQFAKALSCKTTLLSYLFSVFGESIP